MRHLATVDLEQKINQLGIRTVLVASIILIICALLALLFAKHKKIFKITKLPLFLVMASTLVIATAILFGATIYLNTKAESKGPVHWHADIEFWVCGAEIELRDPHGFLSNKIGTATYHEHNDKRIHLEGVVVRKSEDASLKKFMTVIGGMITKDRIGIPLNEEQSEWFASGEQIDGDVQKAANPAYLAQFVSNSFDVTNQPVLLLENGMKCGQQRAELQAFVYRYDKATETYSQSKLYDPREYVLRDESNVPPGDCVIVEFDVPKERTDKLCEQYGVRDAKRCSEFGVKPYNPKLCKLREITGGSY